ncbi:MAG: PrsW family intramembrane metalloprotease [Hamadaea sp.]|uniref:PrsW family intramembrane metalloprotease n=1 Tax=Hamadaea sp. TaxID=2024425 RepID=UPI0017E6599C|nr:PrsW family intramembrane metalloprotease [Hamadaea sp.]NUT17610.1 PrsW family intramembrane metalloprotease [Hamadaea sp.]
MSTASVRPTPRTARAVRSLQMPAFWLLAGLLLVCGLRLLGIFETAYGKWPTATLTAIVLFGLYAVPFWLFIASLDFLEREPWLLLATAFAWGAAVAPIVAIPGNRAVHDLLAKLISPEFAAAWGSAIAGPTVEELLKGLGVIVLVLIARAQINSVLDGMVYGALVGLGFQIVEDIIYAVNAVAVAGQGDEIGPVISTVFLRGFLAGLWSHTIFSALVGGGIAYFLVHPERSLLNRLAGALVGFGGAWLLHFLWNSPLLADGVGGGAGGILLGLLIKGIPALVLVLSLAWLARSREARFYLAELGAVGDPHIATEGEVGTLAEAHLRARARHQAKKVAGGKGERAVRTLQRAQCRYAVELARARTAHGAPHADPVVAKARESVLEARHKLAQLGIDEALPGTHKHRRWLWWMLAAVLVVLLLMSAFRALGGG